ncbi:MAG: amidohydrolase family protein [Bacteroidetes bacterium]|nr:amidohydrolase family protein [Bacteroidota bacterium]
MALISAEKIFNGYDFFSKNTVLKISEEGIIEEIFQTNHLEGVNMYKGILMPGMINAHCHLELSHLRNQMQRGEGLVGFLLSIVRNREQATENEKQLAIEGAEREMMQNGIVAVGDISNTIDTLPQKSKGNLRYHTFVECFGLKPERAVDIRNQAKELQQEFLKYHNSTVVLHAPYSVSNQLIALIDTLNSSQITCIHNQECLAENELFLNRSGDFLQLFDAIHFDINLFESEHLNSIQTYLPKCVLQKKMILVHNTVSSEEDVRWANGLDKEIFWCLCPKANLYIEDSLPDIEMMLRNDCEIILGTDSLASNDTLSIWEEIKTIHQHKPKIPIVNMLRWATSAGAKALGMDAMLGSIEVGKRPGILQIALDHTDALHFSEESKVEVLF